MSTMKMSGCMKIVAKMDQDDQDALLARLDQYQADGVPAERAQVMAASDTLAELKAERKEFMALLREQHPDLFLVKPEAVKAKTEVQASERRDVVDTPQFKRWFGDSKVVDAEGKPLMLYHGTDSNFNEFRTNSWEGGAFFTTNLNGAEVYGDKVMQVYLTLKNPLEVSERDWINGNMLNDESAKEAGYDGYVIRNHDIGSDNDTPIIGDTYVAFNPTQIKSAIGNNGDFDAANPDISKSERRSLPGFTSALAKGIEDMPTKQALAGAWQAQIKGLVNKGVVKADELEWSGLNDWLDLQGQPKVVFEPGFGIIQEHKAEDGSWQQVDDLGMYYKTEAEAQAAITDALQSRAAEDGKRDGTEGRVAVQAVPGDALNFGKTMTPKITKAQITEYLEANGVQVQEVVLGGAPFSSPAEAIQYIAESQGESEAWVRENWGYQDDRDYITLAASMVDDDGVDGKTKYEQYTLPGGENYREVLLTLPEKRPDMKAIAAWQARMLSKYGPDMSRMMTAEEQAEGVALNLEPKQQGAYRSSHWDEPNVIAHIRVNDRTDAEGNKVLFVEEIQSDFQQDYRKSKEAIYKAVENDFNGIIERMKKAGVLEVNCD